MSLGWGKSSDTPWKHYTTESAALAPGPLFWEVEMSGKAFDMAVGYFKHEKFTNRMCRQCARPFPEGCDMMHMS